MTAQSEVSKALDAFRAAFLLTASTEVAENAVSRFGKPLARLFRIRVSPTRIDGRAAQLQVRRCKPALKHRILQMGPRIPRRLQAGHVAVLSLDRDGWKGSPS